MNLRQPRRDERVEHQMFPKRAAIFRPKMIPAARVANQARVEAKYFGLRDNFAPSARRKRTDHMHRVRHLINLQPVDHGGAADLAFRGELGHVQHPAALAQQQLQHAQEPGALLQPEKLLHVAREIGVLPFGIKLTAVFLRQQRRRQSAAQQTHPDIRHVKRRQFLVQNRHQLDHPFAAREAVAKFLRRGQRG